MKYLIIIILLLPLAALSQSVLPLRADTVRVEKVGSNGEFQVRSATRNVRGPLSNVGGGATRFIKTTSSGDTLFIAGDTILNARKVDTLYRDGDSIRFTINGSAYAFLGGGSFILYNALGGSGDTLVNADKEVKWLNTGFGLARSNTGTTVTHRADTTRGTGLPTYYYVDSSVAVGGGGTVFSEHSVTGDGSSGNKLKLVNDITSPATDMYYGTNYSGTRNWVQPNVNWHNLVKDGADPTGATDISTLLTTAMAAGYKNIYLPDGYYLVSSQIQLKDSVVIRGAGRGRTFIKLTSNITAFKLSFALGGNLAQITDLTFQGTFGGAGNTSQKGIVIDSAYGCIMNNVGGYFMAGFVISIANNGLISPSNKYVFGNQITDCYFETCHGGVLLDVRGEYNTISSTTAVDGVYGFYVSGGNNKIVGCNASSNTYNLYLTGGSNNAHGTVTGCTFNHGGTANVYATGVTLGMDVVGCEIYSGNITLLTSAGITFTGGTIEAGTITSTTCTFINFFGTRFGTVPTWTITGNAPGVYRLGEASTAGFIFEDVVNNKQTELYNANSIFTFGNPSGNTQQFFYNAPIVTKTGNFDATRDFSAGKSRFDLGNTTGDGFQIYKTGSSGSLFALIDNSANYLAYGHPDGWFSVGNNSTRSISEIFKVTGRSYFNGSIFAHKDSITKVTPTGVHEVLYMDTATGRFHRADAPAAATTIYTGDGSLSAARTITGGSNTLTLTGTQSSLSAFNVSNTGNGGAGSFSSTGTGSTLTGANSSSGNGVLATSSSGNGLSATSVSSIAARFKITPSSTNTVAHVIRTIRGSSGTIAAGAGGGLDMWMTDAGGNDATAVSLAPVLTTATAGATTADLQIFTTNAGSSTLKFTLKGNGQQRLHAYTTGAFTGTPTDVLASDASGNVIQATPTQISALPVFIVLAADPTSFSATANSFTSLPVLSSNEVITLPSAASNAGRQIVFWNKNTSGNTWTFSAAITYPDGTTSTAFPNGSTKTIASDGSIWLQIATN